MTPMEQAIADHRQAAQETRETNDKGIVAERERERLKDALAALESKLASAEQAHANADAAQQLGEPSDLEATQAALDAARKALTDAAPDLKHKIRVSELLVEKLHAMTREADDKRREALAALNARLNEKLREQLHTEVAEANRLADAWVAAVDKATATRELYIDRHRSGPYGIATGLKSEKQEAMHCKGQPHQSHEAMEAHKQALLAEIASATRV